MLGGLDAKDSKQGRELRQSYTTKLEQRDTRIKTLEVELAKLNERIDDLHDEVSDNEEMLAECEKARDKLIFELNVTLDYFNWPRRRKE